MGDASFRLDGCDLQDELRQAKQELEAVDEKMTQLKARRKQLVKTIDSIKKRLNADNESDEITSKYNHENFPWSTKLRQQMQNVFGIKSFRSLQLPAINATMRNVDCLLVAPTGGGKSLVFQLPAVIEPGVTLVVSPLVSLMVDQELGLKNLGIQAGVFNSQTDKEKQKELMGDMVDPKNMRLKLVYVTPEKLAQSKRFMHQLEKMYTMKRLRRIVIDEVHCCSQWGHDFRKDYKFLNIMKTQFPDVPILGLTATATDHVLMDVQKILNIEGCVVFKDSFYRANLKYEILDISGKNTNNKESNVLELVSIIQSRFPDQCGLVYCLTIKDTEDVASLLNSHGISAACYHAQMDPPRRSKAHSDWINGEKNSSCTPPRIFMTNFQSFKIIP